MIVEMIRIPPNPFLKIEFPPPSKSSQTDGTNKMDDRKVVTFNTVSDETLGEEQQVYNIHIRV
jgi:translation initiation factor 1